MNIKFKLDKLYKFMAENFYTMNDVAEKSGLCLATLSNYESGKRYITIKSAKKIASVFDVKFDDLFEMV